MLVTDDLVRMQRVAVAVQARDRDAGALEQAEVVVAGGIAGQDVVERRDVHRRQEAAGIDLDAGQAQVGDDLQGPGEAAVVQDRVVYAELHADTFSWLVETAAPSLAADSATAASSSMLWTPSSKVAQRGRLSASGTPATSSRKARAWEAKA